MNVGKSFFQESVMRRQRTANKAVQRGHFAALLERVNSALLHFNTFKQSCKMPVNGDVMRRGSFSKK